jgi:hypothetical protein
MDRYPRSSMLEAPKVQWIGWVDFLLWWPRLCWKNLLFKLLEGMNLLSNTWGRKNYIPEERNLLLLYSKNNGYYIRKSILISRTMGLTHCSLSHLESQRTMQNLKEQCGSWLIYLWVTWTHCSESLVMYESLGLIALWVIWSPKEQCRTWLTELWVTWNLMEHCRTCKKVLPIW